MQEPSNAVRGALTLFPGSEATFFRAAKYHGGAGTSEIGSLDHFGGVGAVPFFPAFDAGTANLEEVITRLLAGGEKSSAVGATSGPDEP